MDKNEASEILFVKRNLHPSLLGELSGNDKFVQELDLIDLEIQTLISGNEYVKEAVGCEYTYEDDFEEYLDDESTDENYEYESDFEDDSDEESTVAENEDDNRPKSPFMEMMMIDLGYGITMRIPSQFADKIHNLAAVPWSVERRNCNIMDLKLQSDDNYCTDIYDLVLQNTEPYPTGGSNDTFSVPDDCNSDIEFRVLIDKLEKGSWFHYYARVMRVGNWIKLKGTYNEEDSSVTFKVRSVSSLCITRTPITTTITVPEGGYTYTADQDTRVEVTFPKGAIKGKAKINFTLLPIDREGMNWRLENHPDDYNIVAMSDILFVQQSLSKFHKAVAVHLPLDIQEGDYELIFIKWKKGAIEFFDSSINKTIEMKSDCGKIMVDSFSGYCAAIIRPRSLHNITPTEVETNRGAIKLCNILLFVKKHENTTKYFTLWIDIVKKNHIAERVAHRENELGLTELTLCRSHDIMLKDEEKIRIEIEGNIKFARGRPKASNVVTLLTAAQDNHLAFPVEIYQCASGVPYAIVNFQSAKISRRTIYSTHFNPTFMFPHASRRPVFTRNSSRKESLGEYSEYEESPRRSQEQEKGFFSELNMVTLASVLPICAELEFGVNLGISSEELYRLKGSSNDNPTGYFFKILKIWLSNSPPSARLSVLLKALKNCGQTLLAGIVDDTANTTKLLDKAELLHKLGHS